MKRQIIFLIAIFSIAATATADATPRNGRHKRQGTGSAVIVCDDRGCSDRPSPARAESRDGARDRARSSDVDYDANGNTVVVGRRPAGCPHQYCGCEASLYVFGEIRPELNLASNWIRKFPRAAPSRGMVAARSGHVMVLMSHMSGKDWLVHDGNSGGGRTREHVRSIGGYVIVDPRGSRSAQR